MKDMIEQELLPPVAEIKQVRGWKPYDCYTDSGIEWLGKIPEYWWVRRIKYVVEINVETLKENVDPDYILQYIDISNVDSNGIIRNLQEISFKDAPNRARRIARNGDTILSTVRTYLRAIAYINTPPENLVVSTGFAVIRARQCITAKFLYHYLQSHRFIDQVVAHSEGVGYPAINPGILACLNILVPPLIEQQAIVSFLDRETAKLNALIAKRERMIELLQERRIAVINQAVTKGLNPDVKMKDSGVEWLGMIPEHWETKRVKRLATILRGRFSHRPRNDPKLYDGPYPFIQTGDITASNKYITAYKQTLNTFGYEVSKEFPSQTLVMAIAANIGDLAILQFNACFPDSIVGFIPSAFVNLEYLYYNLLSMKQEMLSTATINTQLNLNIERIGSLITVLPPISEQKVIVSYLDQETSKIDKLITGIQQSIQKLKEYNTALISAAVTGKIDVRGEVDAVDAESAESVAG